MHTWPLQDAQSHFSALVNATLTEGPQMVIQQGQEAVVLLAAHEYRRIVEQKGGTLIETLLHAPRGEPLVLDRSREPVRDLGL